MALPNLALRGSTYWWRRRICVGGQSIPLALSFRTGIFLDARLRAGHLSAAVERLRMAYGERGSSIAPDTLKKIFGDAMRWQLERIVEDQTASGVDPALHTLTNDAYAEMWRIFARPDPRWTAGDDERLAADGWSREARLMVADLWEQNRHGHLISQNQLKAYESRFGFPPTASNLKKVQHVILAAREAACREATARIVRQDDDPGQWVDDALRDVRPFVFDENAGTPPGSEAPPPVPAEQKASPSPVHVHECGDQHASSVAGSPLPASSGSQNQPAQPPAPHKLLREAAEECIHSYLNAKAWSSDTVEQVQAAIRLFDFGCGGGVAVEDLKQSHVTAFHELCHKMPNRWGKTRDEMDRGIVASLDYAEAIKAKGQSYRLGFTSKTINKHVTWIESVLRYADDNGSDEGHRPDKALRFKTDRSSIGIKAQTKKQRSRDLRANWTRSEIERLLEAPIWWGCEDLDCRFQEGSKIYHDAWYWLPLMYILYGGRSSELAGLPLADVFEDDAIPYFKVDYTDLRALKTAQSIRKLPIHPELIRLGFLEYVQGMRRLDHAMLFPEMHSSKSKSFASAFYRSVFRPWRTWAFPDGTPWRHQARGAVKDKDVHSFRGVATSMMKGKVEDSVRFDILGHEGENTTTRIYDEEAELSEKLKALHLVSPLTERLHRHQLRLRPTERQRFGARRGAPPKTRK